MELNSWSLIALDKMPDGIVFVYKGLIEYSNPALSDLLHVGSEDINGKKFDEIIYPEDRSEVMEVMDEIVSGGPEFPSTIRLAGYDEKPISTEFIPRLVLQDENDLGWICLFRDLTIETRIQEAIGEVDEKYRTLVENAPEAIVVYDANMGRFVDANEKAVWLFGLERNAIFRVGFVELSADFDVDGDAFLENLQQYIRRSIEGEIVEFEWLCKGAEARTIPCEVKMVLLPTVGRNLIRCSLVDITDRKQAEEELIHEALFDTLTGLPNRNLFFDRLDTSVRRALSDADFNYAVVFFDIDRFKNVNDSLGHMAGDQLLVAVANRLKNVIGENDLAARIAGDEFTILLEAFADPDYPNIVADGLLGVFLEPFEISGQEVRVSASFGIAMGSTGYNKPENILRDADTAMYYAKTKGKARYVFFDPDVHPRAVDLLQIENELRMALLRDEFKLFYEPIVSLPDLEISGLEVFVRWQHPQRGLLSPAEFIKHAEEVGMMAMIDDWVLRNACAHFQGWRPLLSSPGRLAVNLSAHHIHRKNIVMMVEEALKEAGMPATSLELELLESVLVDDVERVVEIMRSMKNLGLRISLDDFGAVYSSLNQLRYLPVDNLRIDKTLIHEIVADEPSRAIVTSIISLAKSLDIGVIAEGVENEGQLQLLNEWGCEEAQGFLFGPSRTADEVADLIDSGIVIK